MGFLLLCLVCLYIAAGVFMYFTISKKREVQQLENHEKNLLSNRRSTVSPFANKLEELEYQQVYSGFPPGSAADKLRWFSAVPLGSDDDSQQQKIVDYKTIHSTLGTRENRVVSLLKVLQELEKEIAHHAYFDSLSTEVKHHFTTLVQDYNALVHAYELVCAGSRYAKEDAVMDGLRTTQDKMEQLSIQLNRIASREVDKQLYVMQIR